MENCFMRSSQNGPNTASLPQIVIGTISRTCKNYLKDSATFGDVRVTSSQAIWDRMERMPEFNEKYEQQKLLFVLNCARAASTGAGAHSVYIDFCHILKLNIVNDDWISFFKQYLALMTRIRAGGSALKTC